MKKLSFALVLVLASCSMVSRQPVAGAPYFVREVKPVLEQHCLSCHNGKLLPPPAMNLSNTATAFALGAGGKRYIVPGKPDSSLLIQAVQRGGIHPKMMPRTDISLTDDQIGMLREWIDDGAAWPLGTDGELKAAASGERL